MHLNEASVIDKGGGAAGGAAIAGPINNTAATANVNVFMSVSLSFWQYYKGVSIVARTISNSVWSDIRGS
jgi:hypothetical protein